MNPIQLVRKQMLKYFLFTSSICVPIFLILYCYGHFFLDDDFKKVTFLQHATQLAGFYNLILGLLTMGSTVQAYVYRGVTRRDYFIGTAQAIFMHNIALTCIFTILHVLLTAIGQSELNAEILTLIAVFFFKSCLFYFLSTTISSSYYRFTHSRWWFFIIFIISGFLFTILFGYVWGEPFPLALGLPRIEPSPLWSVLISFILIKASIVLSYQFTTKMSVRC